MRLVCSCVLAAAAVIGCVPEQPPVMLWSHEPKSYLSDRDFAAGLYSSAIVIIAHTPDRPERERSG